MANLQDQYKLAGQTYGDEVLNLVVARGYIGKLIGSRKFGPSECVGSSKATRSVAEVPACTGSPMQAFAGRRSPGDSSEIQSAPVRPLPPAGSTRPSQRRRPAGAAPAAGL